MSTFSKKCSQLYPSCWPAEKAEGLTTVTHISHYREVSRGCHHWNIREHHFPPLGARFTNAHTSQTPNSNRRGHSYSRLLELSPDISFFQQIPGIFLIEVDSFHALIRDYFQVKHTNTHTHSHTHTHTHLSLSKMQTSP